LLVAPLDRQIRSAYRFRQRVADGAEWVGRRAGRRTPAREGDGIDVEQNDTELPLLAADACELARDRKPTATAIEQRHLLGRRRRGHVFRSVFDRLARAIHGLCLAFCGLATI